MATEIVGRYDRLDPTDKVPRGLLEDAIVFYDMNLALIPKTKYFVVTDMSLYSGKDRYWLVEGDDCASMILLTWNDMQLNYPELLD